MSITAELVKMLHELSDKFVVQGNLQPWPFHQPAIFAF